MPGGTANFIACHSAGRYEVRTPEGVSVRTLQLNATNAASSPDVAFRLTTWGSNSVVTDVRASYTARLEGFWTIPTGTLSVTHPSPYTTFTVAPHPGDMIMEGTWTQYDGPGNATGLTRSVLKSGNAWEFGLGHPSLVGY